MNIYSSHAHAFRIFMHLCGDAVTPTISHFRQNDLDEQLIHEIATAKARCVSSQAAPAQHSLLHHLNGDSLVETQNLALLSQQFFNIGSKGLFSWVVLTDCYISNKYGQSVQSFFCAPITEL